MGTALKSKPHGLKNKFVKGVAGKRKKRVNHLPYRAEKNADAVLILEDGSVFWGKGAGRIGSAVGELCFNTSMTGYQEALSDPSYAGQIINFTFPHIGNVGVNHDDDETESPFALGMVASSAIGEFSNYRAQDSFQNWLVKNGLIAITGIDTRALTHKIRDFGAPRAIIAYAPQKQGERKKLSSRLNVPRLLDKVEKWSGLKNMDLSLKVTKDKPYAWQKEIYSFQNLFTEKQNHLRDSYKRKKDWAHIVAIDYGVKHNILKHLFALNAKITVVPANYSAEKILSLKPHGIFLSNGPGDPSATAKYATPILQALLKTKLPIFGICIGHQLLALALGAQTEKMAKGHRGANHPVKNLRAGTVEITSQNHGFQVMPDSLPNNVEITHLSLFDNSLEGIALKDRPVFAVQYHPEASPGPHDSHYLFETFANNIAKSLMVKN